LASVGCSSLTSSPAKAGAISATTSGGTTGTKVTELAILGKLQLSMTPTGDALNAGVDWTVTCGGNPVTGSTSGGACGTLVPAHTADGATTVYTAPSIVPINQSVTITAAVTSNPSQTSSLTFTIVSSSIAVSIGVTTTTPADTLQTSQSVYTSYTVVNDPLNAGVTWTATCGSAACGTFSTNGGIYTAPSAIPTGNTVTLTATSVTDTSKSASVTLTIVAPTINGVTVSVVPGSLYADTGSSDSAHRAQLTAIVANDSSNAGVTWSESCSSLVSSACGSLANATTTQVTYIAPTSIPTGGTVTITAKSVTDPSISNTAMVNIVNSTPISVSLSPAPPATLAAESSLSLSATTTATNSQGVDWTAACASAGSCGTFTSSHTADGAKTTYIAPSNIPTGGIVYITASPTSTPSYPTVAVITIVSSPTVSLAQMPPTPMIAGAQTTVSATVAYDSSNSGVSWTVCEAPSGSSTTPSDCGDSIYGYVYPQKTASGATTTYTAPPVPPGTSVVVEATSVAASTPSIQSGSIAISNSISITANTTPSISFIPSLPAKAQPNATVNLMAAVANDSTSGGVDWQVCGDGCGYFTISPAVPAIAATSTTAYQAPVAAKVTTSVSGWPSGTPLPYTAPPEIPTSGSATITATAHVDHTKSVSGTIAIDTNATGPALNGTVIVGTSQTGVPGTSHPVAGSSVALYAAGTNGSVYKITNGVVEIEYKVQATQIASTTTGKGGSFTIPAGYTCPSSSSQMYLVATGGSAGTSSANANLALMTALGSCGNLSSTPVVVNEVTTVASTFAIGPFTANDALYGTSSYLFLGTSASNTTGLINAFASVNNLVDITTGLARSVTPAGNGTVPYALINFLADILNACAVTSGGVEGDGSACGTLLSGADLLNVDNGGSTYLDLGSNAAPADTLQAVFNFAQLARYSSGAGKMYRTSGAAWSLATSASPFQPIQTLSGSSGSAIAIHYTGGGGISSSSAVSSLAADANGNVWITDSNAGTVVEWNAVGAPAVGAQVPAVSGNTFAESPFTTVSGGGPMAIDASGNVWVSGNGKLAEITSYGTQAPGSPFTGVVGGGSQMAIDKQGNIWLANNSSVVEFDSTGAFVSPAAGFVNTGISNIVAVALDSSNNVDIVANNGRVSQLTNPAGNPIVSGVGGGTSSNSLAGSRNLSYLAADGQGDMWETGYDSLCKIPPYPGTLNGYQWEQELQASNFCSNYNAETSAPGVVLPGGVALDGRGTSWTADQGDTGQSDTHLTSLSLFADYPGGSYQYVSSPGLAGGPLSVAIDASGNIWVLLSDNSVTEFMGEATPVTTPIALGLKNGKLATMP
jgi:sugar lactone lactonase YvrE/ferredoxin